MSRARPETPGLQPRDALHDQIEHLPHVQGGGRRVGDLVESLQLRALALDGAGLRLVDAPPVDHVAVIERRRIKERHPQEEGGEVDRFAPVTPRQIQVESRHERRSRHDPRQVAPQSGQQKVQEERQRQVPSLGACAKQAERDQEGVRDDDQVVRVAIAEESSGKVGEGDVARRERQDETDLEGVRPPSSRRGQDQGGRQNEHPAQGQPQSLVAGALRGLDPRSQGQEQSPFRHTPTARKYSARTPVRKRHARLSLPACP